MAQSPLILNIMSLAYQNTSAEDLGDPSLNTDKSRRRHLFDTYITRMFKRKASARPYEAEQTKQRLAWLAQNMQKHNQEVFLIEGLQPSWLLTNRWQWVYVIVSRLVSGLGIALGLQQVFQMNILLMIGLSIGLSVGFIDILRFEWFRKRIWTRESSTFRWSFINIVVVLLSIELVLWLVFRLIRPRGVLLGVGVLISVIFLGLPFGAIAGLIFGLRGSRQSMEYDIQTVEALRWSWRKALKGGPIGGLIFGLVGVITAGILFGMHFLGRYNTNAIIVAMVLGGLIFGMIGILIGILSSGLSREIIETKSFPNQSILLSIRSAIIGGLASGLSIGMTIGLLSLTFEVNPVANALSGGLFGVVTGALWYGGFDVIQHYILRLILVIHGHIPANYARFLDYAVDRIFLQKVGGGYRFIHRLLLEHFAEMDPLLPPPNPQAK